MNGQFGHWNIFTLHKFLEIPVKRLYRIVQGLKQFDLVVSERLPAPSPNGSFRKTEVFAPKFSAISIALFEKLEKPLVLPILPTISFEETDLYSGIFQVIGAKAFAQLVQAFPSIYCYMSLEEILAYWKVHKLPNLRGSLYEKVLSSISDRYSLLEQVDLDGLKGNSIVIGKPKETGRKPQYLRLKYDSVVLGFGSVPAPPLLTMNDEGTYEFSVETIFD